MAMLEFPDNETLGKMLIEAGNLIASSGRKALEKDWSNACMESMRANQLTARVIKIYSVRDKAQTASIAALKAELAAVKKAAGHVG